MMDDKEKEEKVYLSDDVLEKLEALKTSALLSHDLHPRVGMSVGVSVSTKHGWIKPLISIEIDVPMNMSVDETYVALQNYLLDKLVDVECELITYLEGGES